MSGTVSSRRSRRGKEAARRAGEAPVVRRAGEAPVASSRRELRAAERGTRRAAPAAASFASSLATPGAEAFASSLAALEEIAAGGAVVSLRVADLDRGTEIVAGDDHLVLPVGGVGVVALLVEVAARFETGMLNPLDLVGASEVEPVTVGGVWHRLTVPALPVCDLAVLAAATGDARAANALLARVGLGAVRARLASLGLGATALLDGFRDRRGLDDVPHVALATTRELTDLFVALLGGHVVSPAVSAQVAEWLSFGHDLSLVASATGLDPFAHDDDRHGLLFVNKTGRADGVCAEAGVLAVRVRALPMRSPSASTTSRRRTVPACTEPSTCSAATSWSTCADGPRGSSAGCVRR
ncbi:MAG: serine hydrolase [Pseudorhodoferax sp.]